MDRFDLTLILEPARNLERVRAMPLQAKRQRFQAAQNKKTIERAGNGAHRILQEGNLISEFLIFPYNGNTADEIGMPIQIFRCGMQNDIEPRFDRALDPWSRERIIANRNQFPFARDLRDCVKIDQFEQRITWG